MSDASSLGNAFEGNVTPQIDPPQVGVGPDTDKVGAGVLAPKHPHWRNDPKTKERMDDRSSIKKNKVNEGPKNENYTAVKLRKALWLLSKIIAEAQFGLMPLEVDKVE